jgi:hypothetical protein
MLQSPCSWQAPLQLRICLVPCARSSLQHCRCCVSVCLRQVSAEHQSAIHTIQPIDLVLQLLVLCYQPLQLIAILQSLRICHRVRILLGQQSACKVSCSLFEALAIVDIRLGAATDLRLCHRRRSVDVLAQERDRSSKENARCILRTQISLIQLFELGSCERIAVFLTNLRTQLFRCNYKQVVVVVVVVSTPTLNSNREQTDRQTERERDIQSKASR